VSRPADGLASTAVMASTWRRLAARVAKVSAAGGQHGAVEPGARADLLGGGELVGGHAITSSQLEERSSTDGVGWSVAVVTVGVRRVLHR
jgi:hypothetical protein